MIGSHDLRPGRIHVTALATAFAMLVAHPAIAQSAAPAAGAKPAARGKTPAAVQVVNARDVILTGLVVKGADGTVVATLSQPLAGQKSTRLALKRARGCTFSVEAAFEDESDAGAEALDLCKDSRIRLTE